MRKSNEIVKKNGNKSVFGDESIIKNLRSMSSPPITNHVQLYQPDRYEEDNIFLHNLFAILKLLEFF
jgi:hypothetical protein